MDYSSELNAILAQKNNITKCNITNRIKERLLDETVLMRSIDIASHETITVNIADGNDSYTIDIRGTTLVNIIKRKSEIKNTDDNSVQVFEGDAERNKNIDCIELTEDDIFKR